MAGVYPLPTTSLLTATMEAEGLEMRLAALTAAFGEKAPAFSALLDSQAKANYDAYKFKTTALAPILKERSALAAKIPHFWSTSLLNCDAFAVSIDPVDREVFEHLEDIALIHGDDPRDFELKFTFSVKNPFFKETVLIKKLSATPPKSSAAPVPGEFDLEADLYGSKFPITWTSKEHNLCLKAPKVNPEELEEFDDFHGLGSFFNWFTEEGIDDRNLGEDFLEWFPHATEYAAGMAGDDSEGEGDSDDEDDESEDGAKEIDLESEDERPKKKSKSKK